MNTLKKTTLALLLVKAASANAGMLGDTTAWLIGKLAGKTISGISAKPQPINEKELAGIANETNKLLPKFIDKDTRFDNMTSGPGRRLNSNYTIVTEVASSFRDIDKASLLKYMQSRLTPEACVQPSLQYIIKDGVTLGYSYHGSDGGAIGEFDITAKDCGYAN